MVPALKGEEKLPDINSSSNSRPAPIEDTLPLCDDIFREEEKGLDIAVSSRGISAGVFVPMVDEGGTSNWSIHALVMRLSGVLITKLAFRI